MVGIDSKGKTSLRLWRLAESSRAGRCVCRRSEEEFFKISSSPFSVSTWAERSARVVVSSCFNASLSACKSTFRPPRQHSFRALVYLFSLHVRRTFHVRQDQHTGLAVIPSNALKLASQGHLPDCAARLVQALSSLHVRVNGAAVFLKSGAAKFPSLAVGDQPWA
jgi:hypothetical protein